MGRTDKSKEGSKRNPNEGTSARTRAFSFEDIMSRRKKKQNSNANDKDSKMETVGSANNIMDHPSPDNLQIMRASKDSVKESSKKEESTSRREGGLVERRDTDGHDLEVGEKVKSIHRKSNRAKESTHEKYSHHSSKTGKFNAAVSEKPSGRKRYKDFEEEKEYVEHYRKSKRDDEHDEHYRKSKRDRKGDSHNDDKHKAENVRKSKKHDSVKIQHTKYSERNGYKNYHTEPFYEDPRLRRRSRSLEFDPESVRSGSLSPWSDKHAYHMQEHGKSYKESSRKKHSDGDRYKISGDSGRYRTSGGGDRYRTSGDGDRYRVSGDGDRYRASCDGDRFKASGDGDRFKASGDGDRYNASGDGDRFKASDDGDTYKNSGDGDKYKTSGDGGYSGGHHWKHGSGLGGYSPRKRKSDAAVKTPSPTARSPERKVATWDQLPSGTNITNTGSIFTNFPLAATKVIEAASSFATTPATTKTHLLTSINSASLAINASLESVQLTQATRPLRRLYIENLPPSASEKSVIDHLNEILVSSGANHIQTKPCISCIINKDKAQALVEFLKPEDATAALSFDGNSFLGSVLKMRRPKDFIDATSGVPEKSVDAVRIVSDVVMDSPYKIFVGGISGILSSKMLVEIASSFGPLKAYHSEFNKELNGLCAFLEYEDHMITSKACAVLDGLMLGGGILTAVRASPEINGKEDNESSPSYVVPAHAKPLLTNVSTVIRLQNVVNPDDLPTLPENELEEILDDIRLECTRFGTVKAVHLLRHISSPNEPKPEVSELPVSTDPSTRLESNVEFHIKSSEKFDETHHEDTEASPSNFAGVIKEDEMQEATEPLEELQVIDNSANVQMEDSYHQEEDAVSDTKLAEETNLDPIVDDKEDGEENDGRKFFEERDSKDSRDELQAFPPGCVLVEFQRKEAACGAAHCLHGRSYGELIVQVEYIPYDLYLKRFPK